MKSSKHSMMPFTPGIAATSSSMRAQDAGLPTIVLIIVDFPAGGVADAISRLFAAPLGDALGTSVVVENRAGASGTMDADAVAKAAPDGLTLGVSHAIPFGFAPGVLPSVPYDPVADFTHIAMLAEAPTISVVRANSPFASMQALIAAACTRPVRFGTSGVGSAEHFSGALLARATGAAQLDHIPYRGTAPARQDLLAGQIDMLNTP